MIRTGLPYDRDVGGRLQYNTRRSYAQETGPKVNHEPLIHVYEYVLHSLRVTTDDTVLQYNTSYDIMSSYLSYGTVVCKVPLPM